MKISYDWLKDYVDIRISPEKLAALLTMAGLTVDSMEKKGGDSILEIEITSNRPDWLSYIGVAREVAALTGRKLKVPEIKKIRTTNDERRTTIKVTDTKLCPRYTARIIRNVSVGESPDWLKKRIEAAGLRSVNNIVDITNFCLFETGQPMHAFDLDALSGQSIIVRRAQKNEKIEAIDGTERALEESMLVIADSEKPVAVAGVMGGIDTEVGPSTKNILLESAYFDPIAVRRASRRLALSSESSYRFERKVDMNNIVPASERAAGLILELAGGEMGGFIDIGSRKENKRKINLRFDRLNNITGEAIAPSKAKSILVSLGLKLISATKSAASFNVPLFRQDLQDEIDLIEEVARIYGYGNIPLTVPQVVEMGARMPPEMIIDDKIRSTLSALGLYEIITYGLLNRESLGSALDSDADAVEIKNPLSAEQEIMRPSAIAGMLKVIRYNINRKSKDLGFYELGKVYLKEGASSFKEKRELLIGITGSLYDGWIGHQRPVTLFDLKGTVETLFMELGAGSISTRDADSNTFSPQARSAVEVKGEPVGIMGEVSPKALDNFDIKDKVYIARIDCEALFRFVSLEKHFQGLARYPSVLRDISIVAPDSISNDKIISSIKEAAGKILKDIQLVDRYRGGQIPDGKNGLTYRIEYQDVNRTLEEKDVQDAHSRVVRTLENELGIRLR